RKGPYETSVAESVDKDSERGHSCKLTYRGWVFKDSGGGSLALAQREWRASWPIQERPLESNSVIQLSTKTGKKQLDDVDGDGRYVGGEERRLWRRRRGERGNDEQANPFQCHVGSAHDPYCGKGSNATRSTLYRVRESYW
ncbi:hypothetical protein TorRG33x02_056640, partial [Trema orientale]